MNVSLAPELERFVNRKVESGLYTSASEVIREALRLLAEKEAEQEAKLQALRGMLQEGLQSGTAQPFALDELKKKARAKKAAQHG